MKKKLKDFTIGELYAFCKDRDCLGCPFSKLPACWWQDYENHLDDEIKTEDPQ